ncbi:DUF5691 domain-containing protein [Roseibacillus persicicus]|uniref:DUF5691 domain-containing protein n=1 Tax=Roseibacillus persicicus TaxID=454148 RepID=UPI00280F3DD7|nr:DUF5691 domain-containing protein [Roseibacillus persicicus]MDQ8191690.1 DUF5691 domain-containing protein [Roseibacillus persicicus]
MTSSLTSHALLGTARSGPWPDPPHELLVQPWAALAKAPDPASALLQAAALERTLLRAGQKPLGGAVLAESCPPETRDYLPEKTLASARRMLAGDYPELLPEWLALATQSQLLVPPRLIPDFFQYGKGKKSTIPQLIALAGQRGQWFAQADEAWKAFRSSAPSKTFSDDVWDTGENQDRLAWLEKLFAENPEDAGQIVTDSWRSETPDNREVMSSFAYQYPHPAHLVWLETQAFKEHRQSTRSWAARALLLNRESNYYQFSSQLFLDTVRVEKKKLLFTPPETFVSQWSDYGLIEKAPAGKGKKAHWLEQILSLFPVTQWPQLLGITAKELYQLKPDPDWFNNLLAVWVDDLSRNPSPEHAIPIITLWLKNRTSLPKNQQSPHLALRKILQALESSDQADILAQLTLEQNEILNLLATLAPPFSAKSHPALHKVVLHFLQSKDRYLLDRPHASRLASAIAPEDIPSLLTTISQLPELPSIVEHFALTLEFRQSYLPHFTRPN